MSERKILIMDDDEDVRFFMECVMNKLGISVDGVTNGDQAVACYEAALSDRKPYLAVILDLRIPGSMGGLETAGKILEMDGKATLYVSSGDNFDPVMVNYADYGFSGKINKPFTFAEAQSMFKGLINPSG